MFLLAWHFFFGLASESDVPISELFLQRTSCAAEPPSFARQFQSTLIEGSNNDGNPYISHALDCGSSFVRLNLLSSRLYTLRPPVRSTLAAKRLLHRLWTVRTKAYEHTGAIDSTMITRCNPQRLWAGNTFSGLEPEQLSAQCSRLDDARGRRP